MEHNTYLIDNLGLASFLAAKGLRLIGTEPAPNKRGIVAFRFSDPENRAGSLIADFYVGGTVVARDFRLSVDTNEVADLGSDFSGEKAAQR
jgi:hypothetical protein